MKPTQEQVIAWAREAGFYGSEILGDHEYDVVGLVSDLERFAALVSATELHRLYEVNAKLMDAMVDIDMSGIRYKETPVETVGRMRGIARAALAKAQGQTALQRLNKAAEDNGDEL